MVTLRAGDKIREWTVEQPFVLNQNIAVETWLQENRIRFEAATLTEDVYDFPLQDSRNFGIDVPPGSGSTTVSTRVGTSVSPRC